jgi:hypothetical protein
MTPLEARTIVASAMRQGLLQAPEQVARGVDTAALNKRRSEGMRQHWERLAAKRGSKPWHELTRQEQLDYQSMCMRRLRAERRGEVWAGPARVQERERGRNWRGCWMENAA